MLRQAVRASLHSHAVCVQHATAQACREGRAYPARRSTPRTTASASPQPAPRCSICCRSNAPRVSVQAKPRAAYAELLNTGCERGFLSPTARRGRAERERNGALRSCARHTRYTPVTNNLHRTLPPKAPCPSFSFDAPSGLLTPFRCTNLFVLKTSLKSYICPTITNSRCHDSSFSQYLFNNFSRHRWEPQRIIELVEKLEQLNPERSSIAML